MPVFHPGLVYPYPGLLGLVKPRDIRLRRGLSAITVVVCVEEYKDEDNDRAKRPKFPFVDRCVHCSKEVLHDEIVSRGCGSLPYTFEL